jgi:hypothetical protein
MKRPAKIVPLNIDLSERCFDLALKTFEQQWPLSTTGATVIDRDNLADAAVQSAIHLAVFFERSLSLTGPRAEVAEDTLTTLLDLLGQYQLKPGIAAVNLIDCGTDLCGPLSSFSVLRHKLEIATAYVPVDTTAHIYAIDFDGELEMGTPKAFFDTTSRAFRSHLGRFIDSTLTSLNSSLGHEKIPQFRQLESMEFDSALSRVEWGQRASVQ